MRSALCNIQNQGSCRIILSMIPSFNKKKKKKKSVEINLIRSRRCIERPTKATLMAMMTMTHCRMNEVHNHQQQQQTRDVVHLLLLLLLHHNNKIRVFYLPSICSTRCTNNLSFALNSNVPRRCSYLS